MRALLAILCLSLASCATAPHWVLHKGIGPPARPGATALAVPHHHRPIYIGASVSF